MQSNSNSNQSAQFGQSEIAKAEFIESFKKMLVRRYNWSVKNANDFHSPELEQAFTDGLDKHQAYFKIFNVDQNLCSTCLQDYP